MPVTISPMPQIDGEISPQNPQMRVLIVRRRHSAVRRPITHSLRAFVLVDGLVVCLLHHAYRLTTGVIEAGLKVRTSTTCPFSVWM